MAQTYYEILGVTKETTDDDLKSSYRRLAIKYHPDKNPNDPSAADKFQEISLAYQVLSDPVKRKAYEEELAAPKKAPAQSPAHYDTPGFDLADSLRIFMDALRSDRSFQRHFYRTDAQGGQNRGSNVQIDVTLSLLEIMDGTRKKISVSHKKKCKTCDGSGDGERRTRYVPCQACNGQGKVRVANSNEIRHCQPCFGTGVVPIAFCPACSGGGYVQGATELMVTFDKGISEGNYISIPGMGHFGLRGAPSGDLIIVIHEKKQGDFTRKGYDLESEITISLKTAVEGGTASVSDLKDQSHEVAINPGTNPGTLIRLTGLGLPYYKKESRGNLYLRVNVEIPNNLSNKALESFKQFSAIMEKEAAENNYSPVGRYRVISLQQENKINRMQAAFSAAENLIDARDPIALDLSRLVTINSTTIGKIIAIHRKMELYNEKLVIVGAKATTYAVFIECNLDKIFTFVKTLDELKDHKEPIRSESAADSKLPIVYELHGHWIIHAGTDAFNADVLNAVDVLDLFKKKGLSIGIDLRGVPMINSMAVGLMIRKYKEAKKADSRLFLYCPGKNVMDVLNLTSLDKLFTIIKNEKELQSLKPI